jgi:hypothetical protein
MHHYESVTNAPDRRPLRDDVRLYVVQTHSNRSVGQRPDLGLKSHKAAPAPLAVETIFIPPDRYGAMGGSTAVWFSRVVTLQTRTRDASRIHANQRITNSVICGVLKCA